MKKTTLFKTFASTLLTAWMLLIVCAPQANARTYTSETLNYQIVYHWGLIWKHAGNAQLTVNRSAAGNYNAQLVAKTRSWADKIYPVRDTLKVTMNPDFTPIKYDKITHEKSYFAHDIVKFSYADNKTTGRCTRYRKNKPTVNITLQSPGNAYDMLSVFYMLRNLDFEHIPVGKTYTTTVFSGKSKETLTITYKGVQNIKLRDGSKHNAFHVQFSFTQDGRKKSSDDLDTWLSTGEARIPLMFVGKLPIGEVRCYLGGKLND